MFHTNAATHLKNPKKVSELLERLLGSQGSGMIERSIVRQTYQNLGATIPERLLASADFEKLIANAKTIFESRMRKHQME